MLAVEAVLYESLMTGLLSCFGSMRTVAGYEYNPMPREEKWLKSS